ncbi:MAG: SIMPL domain-containing protein [Bacteroidales bacterium]|nr:SIMPL domain-containing protein [Bacteroidales bacterium]
MKLDLSKIICGALVSVGLLLLGICIKGGIDNFANRGRQVTVRGLSERTVEANMVTWPIVTKEMGNDLVAIYNNIQATNAKISAFLKSNGLADNEFSINPPVVEDRIANRYNDDNSVRTRYLVTNVIVVTSSKVKLVNSLIDKQPELMRQGIAVVAGDYQYQTNYEYTNLNQIKPEMIAEATKAAREAADRFAADSHSSLGKIQTASQGQFSIEDRDQYTPYIKTIRVVNSITYALEN